MSRVMTVSGGASKEGIVSEKKFQLVVRAMIRDEQGRILLMQRSAFSTNHPGLWELPGGKPDAGEDIGLALRREMKEETGFDVELMDVVGHGQWDKPEVRMIYLIFTAHIIGGSFQRSTEHDAEAWVSDEQVFTFALSPQLKRFFQHYVPPGSEDSS
jgi:8-oxo-dGTP diphosphatase